MLADYLQNKQPLAKAIISMGVIFILLLLSGNAVAQNSFLINGKVVNKANGEEVPYATVINPIRMNSTLADEDAHFSIKISKSDSISISSIGYKRASFAFPMQYKEDSVYIFILEPTSEAIDEVTVTGKKFDPTWMNGVRTGEVSDLSPELRKYKGIFPSKKNRNLRKYQELLAEEEKWTQLNAIFNEDFVHEVTGLESPMIEEFMAYINLNYPLAPDANEYDVRVTIAKAFPEYLDAIKDRAASQ